MDIVVKVGKRRFTFALNQFLGYRNSINSATARAILAALDQVNLDKRIDQLVEIIGPLSDNPYDIPDLAKPLCLFSEKPFLTLEVLFSSNTVYEQDRLTYIANHNAYPILRTIKDYEQDFDVFHMMQTGLKYTNALYEFLQFNSLGMSTTTITVPIVELREIIRCTGFTVTSDFKRRVIVPAAKEIEDLFGWSIGVTLIYDIGKTCQSNHKISFSIDKNAAPLISEAERLRDFD